MLLVKDDTHGTSHFCGIVYSIDFPVVTACSLKHTFGCVQSILDEQTKKNPLPPHKFF